MNTTNRDRDALLTRKQASELLGLSVHTLASWTSHRTDPLPVYKFGRAIRYRAGDVIDFRNRCRVEATKPAAVK